MAMFGHRTRAIFDRYDIVPSKDLKQAQERIQAQLLMLPSAEPVLPMPESKAEVAH